jgi:hypothetical protein
VECPISSMGSEFLMTRRFSASMAEPGDVVIISIIEQEYYEPISLSLNSYQS